MSHRFTKPMTLAAGVLVALVFSSCGPQVDNNNKMIVSVRDQKMVLMKDNQPIKTYKISTSKFGVGDNPRSNRTPLGH
ncbi:MAG: L,D-transpeptidase, partial [bacterium]